VTSEHLGRHTLHVGDCVDVMRELPDASADAVVTDPPYGTASKTKAKVSGGKIVGAFDIGWDRVLPTEWIKDAVRLLRPGGAVVAFTDTKAVSDLWRLFSESGVRPLQIVYWSKPNPPCNMRKSFQNAVEPAIFARKPGKIIAWNGGGATRNIFSAPVVSGVERSAHETQKPLTLMRWLVRLVTPPGGVVLEPFAGSGTTLLACELEGARCIAIEREAEYAEIIRARYDAREVLRAMQNGDTPDAKTREAIQKQIGLFGETP
jgi:DNA modification methylase